MRSRRSAKVSPATTMALGAVGIMIMVGGWELVGRGELLGRGLPPFSAVFDSFVDDWTLFRRAGAATLTEAVKGFIAGILFGLGLAVVGLLLPFLYGGIGRVSTLVHSIPWIALGPLLVMVMSQDSLPFTFALLAVFFSSFITISSGLRLARLSHDDLFTVLGSSRLRRFGRLQLPVAVPSLMYAAKLGAPAAIFGVIFGEWFGSSKPTLGLLIVTSLQRLSTERLWAAATITALIAMIAFGLFSLLERAALARFR